MMPRVPAGHLCSDGGDVNRIVLVGFHLPLPPGFAALPKHPQAEAKTE
jgi:hypothetical protein